MIADGTDIGSFIPTVNFKVGNTRLSDYLKTNQADIVDKVLGDDIEEDLEAEVAEGATDSHTLLRTFVKRAIYVSAFLEAIPDLDLQMSEAGFVVASNQAVSPASRERVDKLIANMEERKSKAMDALVVFLLRHSADDDDQYADWRGTDQFAHLTSGYIMSLNEFKSCSLFDAQIGNRLIKSWDDWYSAIPAMKDCMTTVGQYVSDDYLAELLEKRRDSENLTALENSVDYHICCAIAAGSVGLQEAMKRQAVQARNIMLRNIASFTTFRNSDAYTLPALDINTSDGVANFL